MPKNRFKREVNKTVSAVFDVLCVECKRETKHEVLASVDISGTDYVNAGRHSIDYWSHDQIIRCRGCETISFRQSSGNSEDFDLGDEGLISNENEILYPNRASGRNPLPDMHLLPTKIQRIYMETIKALSNDQPVLAGIGIRALVETICNDKKASGNSLAHRIDSLIVLGLLTKDGAAILHKIRTLGNRAAHEVKPHGTESLKVAMDVCEHLLQGVYLLPHHSKKAFK